jgi:hypothetical protein
MPRTKKNEVSEVVSEKHSIPTIEVEKKVAKKSVIDRFRSKAMPASKKTSKDERPTIDIDEDIQRSFIEYSAISEVCHMAEQREKSQGKQIVDDIYERYLDVLWQTKTQPQNPNIKAYEGDRLDATGLFTISTGSRIKVVMPAVNPDEPLEDALVRSLIDLGISKNNAERLVETEVSFVPDWSLNFTDLLRGESKSGKITPSTPVQQDTAERLFMAIQGEDCEGNSLSSKERLEMLKGISQDGWDALQRNVENQTTYSPSLVDGDGFLDRVCGYAETREELGCIMTVFKPVISLRSVKYAVSDSLETKNERLLEECKDLIKSRHV